MNGNRQMDVHFMSTGSPYPVSETFMDFFDEFHHMPPNYPPNGNMYDQDNAYLSMNMNAYKFGFPGPGSTSYYCPYEVNDHLPRMDVSRRDWEYPLVVDEEPSTAEAQPDGNASVSDGQPDSPSAESPEVVWQDGVDPDNMTYEELLDLGETVGTESRGLSQELISMLPTSKCKLGSLFSRKKFGERCVICQMKYKIGDKQTKLPCKHVYHSECITKWLGINKVCPVCNNEVFGDESGH